MKLMLIGKVVKGKGRGKKLGFPTANVDLLTNQNLPEFGVYAGFGYLKGKKLAAAVSFGPAYTFKEEKPVLEAHFFDTSDDLYGQEIRLELIKKVSEMEKFANADDLVKKIKNDCQLVKEILYVQRDH